MFSNPVASLSAPFSQKGVPAERKREKEKKKKASIKEPTSSSQGLRKERCCETLPACHLVPRIGGGGGKGNPVAVAAVGSAQRQSIRASSPMEEACRPNSLAVLDRPDCQGWIRLESRAGAPAFEDAAPLSRSPAPLPRKPPASQLPDFPSEHTVRPSSVLQPTRASGTPIKATEFCRYGFFLFFRYV